MAKKKKKDRTKEVWHLMGQGLTAFGTGTFFDMPVLTLQPIDDDLDLKIGEPLTEKTKLKGSRSVIIFSSIESLEWTINELTAFKDEYNASKDKSVGCLNLKRPLPGQGEAQRVYDTSKNKRSRSSRKSIKAARASK